MTVLSAPAGKLTPSVPAGCTLLRFDLNTAASGQKLMEDVMWAAKENGDSVVPRLVHGDLCFGLLTGGRLVSFGWVMYHDRSVGPLRLKEAPGRVFLYAFHTLREYRNRGFCTAIFLHILQTLGREGATNFIGETTVSNKSALKVFGKAGFLPVARFSYLTVLNRWQRLLRLTVFDDTMNNLF